MSKSVHIESYMTRHKISSLFEDLLTQVARETPEEPVLFLMKILQKKADIQGLITSKKTNAISSVGKRISSPSRSKSTYAAVKAPFSHEHANSKLSQSAGDFRGQGSSCASRRPVGIPGKGQRHKIRAKGNHGTTVFVGKPAMNDPNAIFCGGFSDYDIDEEEFLGSAQLRKKKELRNVQCFFTSPSTPHAKKKYVEEIEKKDSHSTNLPHVITVADFNNGESTGDEDSEDLKDEGIVSRSHNKNNNKVRDSKTKMKKHLLQSSIKMSICEKCARAVAAFSNVDDSSGDVTVNAFAQDLFSSDEGSLFTSNTPKQSSFSRNLAQSDDELPTSVLIDAHNMHLNSDTDIINDDLKTHVWTIPDTDSDKEAENDNDLAIFDLQNEYHGLTVDSRVY